jgi:hypothetical protein
MGVSDQMATSSRSLNQTDTPNEDRSIRIEPLTQRMDLSDGNLGSSSYREIL